MTTKIAAKTMGKLRAGERYVEITGKDAKVLDGARRALGITKAEALLLWPAGKNCVRAVATLIDYGSLGSIDGVLNVSQGVVNHHSHYLKYVG